MPLIIGILAIGYCGKKRAQLPKKLYMAVPASSFDTSR